MSRDEHFVENLATVFSERDRTQHLAALDALTKAFDLDAAERATAHRILRDYGATILDSMIEATDIIQLERTLEESP